MISPTSAPTATARRDDNHVTPRGELDAECVYDLGYARGVREALATFRIAAAAQTAERGR